MSKRPYKSNCKTDEDTILNKAIGKKIKETRNNYFIFKKEIVDGEFRGTYKPVKKLITQTKLSIELNRLKICAEQARTGATFIGAYAVSCEGIKVETVRKKPDPHKHAISVTPVVPSASQKQKAP